MTPQDFHALLHGLTTAAAKAAHRQQPANGSTPNTAPTARPMNLAATPTNSSKPRAKPAWPGLAVPARGRGLKYGAHLQARRRPAPLFRWTWWT